MKQTIIYIFMFLGIISQTSCEDQLNALPTQSKVEGNVIVDQASAEIALNGVYYRFASGGESQDEPAILWAGYHELTPPMLTGYFTYAFGGSPLEERFDPTDYEFSNIWSDAYSLINAANGVIEQTEALSSTLFSGNRKAEIIAEAKLMRAYGHYNLLRYFCRFDDTTSEYGALIRDEFITTNNIAKRRSDVKSTYTFILEDLEEAIKNAPIENKNIYGNQWIAKAMKARVLILRGEGTDYTDVVTITTDIIDNGPYELEEHVEDIFNTKGLTSKEVMLGIQPLANQTAKYDTYWYAYSSMSMYTAMSSFMSLIEDDPRKNWMLTPQKNDDDPTLTDYGIVKGISGEKKEESIAIRLTEMYLLKAEAIVLSEGDLEDAKDLLKTVMEHAGITDFSFIDAITNRDELRLEIYKETIKNLIFEDGIEWTAMIRLPLEEILKIKPAIKEYNYTILPIPADEFEKNPTIGDQNPGYSKI